MVNNSIYLRRQRKVYIEGINSSSRKYAVALNSNLESLGYTLSPALIKAVSTLSISELCEFYTVLVTDLKDMVGANVDFKPMYPNFPEQVKQASETELYLNAAIHYFGDWIGTRILPHYEKEKREDLNDKIEYKIINFGSEQDFELIFTTLLGAKSSITEADKADVEWFIKEYGDDIIRLIPDEIPLKENIALLGGCLIKYTNVFNEIVIPYIKTATDVLRLAVALSDGDISLAENIKFKNPTKPQRRLLLTLLENCKNITEDMLRYKDRWKRLGEKLHPFQYKNVFPKSCEAFDIIRNDKKFSSFNSKIEASLLSKNIDQTLVLLKSRPGEFARRLDNLLRITNNQDDVLKVFEDIASKVSNAVLLQVLTHFKYRNLPREIRTFFPKGIVSRAKAIEYNLPNIDEAVCKQVVLICETELIEKYKLLPPLGNVYIDEVLKNYTVPFALRSASKAIKTISRGSKLDLPEGNTIRFFIWWRDGKHRTDLDLSAIGLDDNHNHKVDIAYYNLKGIGGYHSGDITSAPSGASEFIDIDVELFLKEQIRYVVMCVNSFTSQPFYDLPECFAGFMVRQFANSGEIYDPKTVENKFDLTANTQLAIPMIIDLLERKVHWTDIGIREHNLYSNNVANNMRSITIIAKAMTSLVKPNTYDLFNLHLKARGYKVTNITNANTIFALDKGTTPFDADKIISTYI